MSLAQTPEEMATVQSWFASGKATDAEMKRLELEKLRAEVYGAPEAEEKEPRYLDGTTLQKAQASRSNALAAAQIAQTVDAVPDEDLTLLGRKLYEIKTKLGSIDPTDGAARTATFMRARGELINTILKEQSGAAVTDQEMERFLVAIGDKHRNPALFKQLTKSWARSVVDRHLMDMGDHAQAGVDVSRFTSQFGSPQHRQLINTLTPTQRQMLLRAKRSGTLTEKIGTKVEIAGEEVTVDDDFINSIY